jgi:methyl halide transferase
VNKLLMDLDASFWNDRYLACDTGWDIGAPSTPLKEYIDQLEDKEQRILIPGAGRAYEAEYLHRNGFRNVFLIDLTDAPYKDLVQRCPEFPREHLLVGDFFRHEGQYDLILEQTFFCALDPSLRPAYVDHMHALLKAGGRLVGVLFGVPLNDDRPPFGGSRENYMELFLPHFPDVRLDPCHNSIAPRAGRELWLRAVRANQE